MSSIHHHYLAHMQQTHPFSRLPVLTLFKAKERKEICSCPKFQNTTNKSDLFFDPAINITAPATQFVPNILTLFFILQNKLDKPLQNYFLLLNRFAQNCVCLWETYKGVIDSDTINLLFRINATLLNPLKMPSFEEISRGFSVNTRLSSLFYICFQFRQAIFAMF